MSPLQVGRLKLWSGRASLATVGPITDAFGRFLRTFILSQFLAPDEFGTAIAITVVNLIAELVTDFGLENFVITKTGPDSRRAMAAAHVIQVVRGGMIGIILAMISPWVAAFFGVPDNAPAFAWAGLLPFFRGFVHIGVKQRQQEFDYSPDALVLISAALSAVVGTFLAAWWLRNHNAVLIGYGAEALAIAGASQLLARKPFECRADAEMLRAAMRWGLPLTLNGIGMAMIAQADRLVVGRLFGIEALGNYAVIVNLVLVPLAALIRIVNGLTIPLLVKNKDDSVRFKNTKIWMTWGFCLAGFCCATGCGLLLDILVPLLFGQAYSVSPGMRIFVSLTLFARVHRISSSIGLLVGGRTGTIMLANSVSVLGVAMQIGLAFLIPDVASVMAGCFIGDAALLGVMLAIDFRAMPEHRRSLWRCVVATILGAIVIGGAAWALPGRDLLDRTLYALACMPPAMLMAAGLWRRWRFRETG